FYKIRQEIENQTVPSRKSVEKAGLERTSKAERIETAQELRDAAQIRSDTGQPGSPRGALERGQETGRPDLQQKPQVQPEARPPVLPQEKAPEGESVREQLSKNYNDTKFIEDFAQKQRIRVQENDINNAAVNLMAGISDAIHTKDPKVKRFAHRGFHNAIRIYNEQGKTSQAIAAKQLYEKYLPEEGGIDLSVLSWNELRTKAKEVGVSVKGKRPELESKIREKLQQSYAELNEALEEFENYVQGTLFSTPLDPQIYKLIYNVGAKAVKTGVLKFADFVEQFARRFGSEITSAMSPHLESVWQELGKLNKKIDKQTGDISQIINALGELPQGEIGRPDLAIPSEQEGVREQFKTTDELRTEAGRPDVLHDPVVSDLADKRLAADYGGELERLKTATADVTKISPIDIAVGQKITDIEGARAINSGSLKDIEQALRSMYGYREQKTVAGRALRLGGDPLHQRAETIAEEILAPDKRTEARVRRAKRKKQTDRVNKLIKKQARNILQDDRQFAKLMRIVSAHNASNWEKVKEAVRNILLSGIPTNVVNVIGNITNLTHEIVSRPMEAIFNLLVRSPGAAQIGEFRHLFGASSRAMIEAGRNFWFTGATEMPALERTLGQDPGTVAKWDIPKQEIGKYTMPSVAIGGKTGRTIRWPQRGLGAFDQLFKSFSHYTDVAAQAYRIAKDEGLTGEVLGRRVDELLADKTSLAHQRAYEFARDVVFMQEGGEITQRVRRGVL
ncbi:MAG: hypothetical protein ACYTEO_19890, partial [Planctomycetota bacterium]